jgi:hypothetical protein
MDDAIAAVGAGGVDVDEQRQIAYEQIQAAIDDIHTAAES